MNAERRKEVQKIVTNIQSIVNDLDAIKEAEQTAFDSMPEGLQSGDKGEAMTTWIEGLEAAIDTLETVIEDLGEVK